MACRDLKKGEEAFARIQQQVPNSKLSLEQLDLADLKSIQQFGERYQRQQTMLHLLFNNAGVMNIPLRRTKDGFEMQFGTNYLGHFALTCRLMPNLVAAQEGRVVTLISMAEKMGKLDFENLNAEKNYRKNGGTYAQSKLACLIFAVELARRLQAAGKSCLSVAAHPGYSSTHLQFVGAEMEQNNFARRIWQVIDKILAQPASNGALPSLYAGTAPDVRGGDYYGPDGFLGMRGSPKVVRGNRRAYDPAVAQQLWRISETLTGMKFAV